MTTMATVMTKTAAAVMGKAAVVTVMQMAVAVKRPMAADSASPHTRTSPRSTNIDARQSVSASHTGRLRQSTTVRMALYRSRLHRGSSTRHTSLQPTMSCRPVRCSPTHQSRRAATAMRPSPRQHCMRPRTQLAYQMAPRSTASCRRPLARRNSCSDHHRLSARPRSC